MSEGNPIIIALDYSSAKQAEQFIDSLEGHSCKLKVGLELFIAEGPGFVEKLTANGHQVFLDLKLHDIPNTVASAIRSASNLGVWMMTLHALGGEKMLQAAYEARQSLTDAPELIAVTILTSMEQTQLKRIGIQQSAGESVALLAELALQAQMNGLVCSVHEVGAIREKFGTQPVVVTPGIRMQNDQLNDQSRIATPEQAHQYGANYIVVGRPITQAKDPLLAINQYLESWSSST